MLGDGVRRDAEPPDEDLRASGQPRAIAQTIVELYAQLGRLGYAAEDLYLIRRAYELALSLNACQYRSSGRSLVEHVLGTASVVAALGAEPALTAATVVHAVYVHGGFGTLRKRVGEPQRAQVRKAIGTGGEQIMHCYSQHYWNVRSIPALREGIPRLDELGRKALLIRLSDQVDIYGTREALYYHNVEKRRDFARSAGPIIVAMAEELGYPTLSAALGRAYADVLEHRIAPGLESPRWKDGLVVPTSYRIRPSIALYRRVRSKIWSLTGR